MRHRPAHDVCQSPEPEVQLPGSRGDSARALGDPTTTMTADAPATPDPSESPGRADAEPRFEVRSITGACYTIVEQTGANGVRRYHTAYAGLPVRANDDGTFTIIDTRTRLVRVDRE